jgi:hypothetical protein
MTMALQPLSEFGPLTPDRLAAFEGEQGCRLPDDYRAFLLAHNGAVPAPGYAIPYVDLQDESDEATLHVLFGIQEPWASSANILWRLQADSGRLPAGFLPVGCDPGGNMFLLRVARPKTGEVWLWDHEREHRVSKRKPRANMSRLAGSFSEFLAGFRLSGG